MPKDSGRSLGAQPSRSVLRRHPSFLSIRILSILTAVSRVKSEGGVHEAHLSFAFLRRAKLWRLGGPKGVARTSLLARGDRRRANLSTWVFPSHPGALSRDSGPGSGWSQPTGQP